MPAMNEYSYPTNHPDKVFWVQALWETWKEGSHASVEAQATILTLWAAGKLRLIVDTDKLREKYYAARGEFFDG
jgi:hypothetical protein